LAHTPYYGYPAVRNNSSLVCDGATNADDRCRLWDIIKEQDHSVPIAKLAEDHYKQHGRPLRIAVDEADWRFNNLTMPQVYAIREKSNQLAYQGIEKTMFYRICRLLTLNIRLLFVFDGPKRPWKRGRSGGNRVDYDRYRLLKEMLQHFRIPYHEAPGEAEAECARLQQLGVVDAVWSQDSDTFMFGCDFLIRDDRIQKAEGSNRSKDNTKKNSKSVKVIRGEDIRTAHKLNRDALVMFAMLVGGDYEMKGLEKCGPVIALQAVKAGLGTSLCRCETQADCRNWREQLVSWMPKSYHGFVPFEYPDIKILKKYNEPTISPDESLLNLQGLRKGWDEPIDEPKLLELTSSRFNIWGRSYMNWVGPVLLTRALATGSVQSENPHEIRLTKRKAGTVADEAILERKLAFSPFKLTSLSQKDFEGERAGYWTGAADEPFDPDHRVDGEIPDYWLRKALPPDLINPPPLAPKIPRKRKLPTKDAAFNGQEEKTGTPRKKRKPRTKKQPSETLPSASPSSSARLTAPLSNTATPALQDEYINLISNDEDDGEDSDTLQDIVFPLSRTPRVSGPRSRTFMEAELARVSARIDTSGPKQVLPDDEEYEPMGNALGLFMGLHGQASRGLQDAEHSAQGGRVNLERSRPASGSMSASTPTCISPVRGPVPTASDIPTRTVPQRIVPRPMRESLPLATHSCRGNLAVNGFAHGSMLPSRSFPPPKPTAISQSPSISGAARNTAPAWNASTTPSRPDLSTNVTATQPTEESLDPSPSNREQLREARLRHFVQERTNNASLSVTPTPSKTIGPQRSPFKEPDPLQQPSPIVKVTPKVAIECIDLTND
jgi:Holliday junction resolvase YEN1